MRRGFFLSGVLLLFCNISCITEVSGEEISSASAPGVVCDEAPFPILLHHGLSGFDNIGPIEYYFGVADDLRFLGETVFETEVSPFASSEVRGVELADIVDIVLEETGACKVNIIAHSQGGIDVRFLIGTLGYGDRIGGVITVATPHKGTILADIALGLAPGFADPFFDAIAGVFGFVIGNVDDDPDFRAALESLSIQKMQGEFAAENPDDSRVAFFSVAGRSLGRRNSSQCRNGLWSNPLSVDLIDPLLLGTGLILQGNPFFPTGNDGLVTVNSSKHGVFLGCIPADHLDQVGQLLDLSPSIISGFDHIEFYRDLVTILHDQNL